MYHFSLYTLVYYERMKFGLFFLKQFVGEGLRKFSDKICEGKSKSFLLSKKVASPPPLPFSSQLSKVLPLKSLLKVIRKFSLALFKIPQHPTVVFD